LKKINESNIGSVAATAYLSMRDGVGGAQQINAIGRK